MSEKKGIKELSEVFVAAGAAVSIGKKIAEDGVGTEDVMTLFSELMAKYPMLVEGAKGIKEALAEAKDLDAAEIVQLVELVDKEIEKIEAI